MKDTTMLLFLHRLLKDAATFCTFEKIEEIMIGQKEVSGMIGLQETASINKNP